MKELLFLIVFVVASRFAIVLGPEWANFSPLGALALYSGYYIRPTWFAVLTTFCLIIMSNMAIDNILYTEYYDGISWGINVHVFIFLLITWMGARRRNIWLSSIVSAVVFFLLSNYFVYLSAYTNLYAAYVAGLPFFKNTLISQLLFTALLEASRRTVLRYNVS